MPKKRVNPSMVDLADMVSAWNAFTRDNRGLETAEVFNPNKKKLASQVTIKLTDVKSGDCRWLGVRAFEAELADL